MDRIKRIYTYEDGTSNTGAMMGIFVVAIIALFAIGMAVWQPWNSQTPVTNETRIIQQPANNAPDTTIINPPNTTIINPPAEKSEPNTTEININEGATGSPNSGTTTGGETTGGDASTTGG